MQDCLWQSLLKHRLSEFFSFTKVNYIPTKPFWKRTYSIFGMLYIYYSFTELPWLISLQTSAETFWNYWNWESQQGTCGDSPVLCLHFSLSNLLCTVKDTRAGSVLGERISTWVWHFYYLVTLSEGPYWNFMERIGENSSKFSNRTSCLTCNLISLHMNIYNHTAIKTALLLKNWQWKIGTHTLRAIQ
jgi:hypothetical protein